MRRLACALILVLASLASLVVGRRVELVIAVGDHACGAECCCAPETSDCCAPGGQDMHLPRIAGTCGCGRPGELHVVLVTGEWVLPVPGRELPRAARAPVSLGPVRVLASTCAEPETPPPRGALDRAI